MGTLIILLFWTSKNYFSYVQGWYQSFRIQQNREIHQILKTCITYSGEEMATPLQYSYLRPHEQKELAGYGPQDPTEVGHDLLVKPPPTTITLQRFF